ncbi:DEAD-domain-containing protein [Cylindrobasidium torrendii FP15055 ss-10]|uniref:DEAD-domain-containing protein n=1 Tax=Cylindrobasidium torrendii FP15055 ss-10 TaxID=1314674 RepID=A0A0D7BU57_9AGAR|nr:DEAD-domain-containing protein [Cylindrobasidium torrendii FP15055 ss-10]
MADHDTFASLGLIPQLVDAAAALNFTRPTPVQQQCIPAALQGKDIIALAPTGSGKTAAFALPIIQRLWESPRGIFACVLAPTRELAYQISSQFEALGAGIGVRCAVIVGGDVDKIDQAVALAKKPHIIIATPGRLLDHLKTTKGFHLKSIQHLVLDEADRLLDLDFGASIDLVLQAIPTERTTYLFSATMTTKVAKLQRASLRDHVRVEAGLANQTVDTLLQYYILCPLVMKDANVVALIESQAQSSMIIFVRTIHNARRLAGMLRMLTFSVVPLHGELTQTQRLGALAKFKSGERKILVATDVVSRGLDIPLVDLVINYDMPTTSKDYIHRVGRTARAGRAGKAVTLITQYDVELLQRLEKAINCKLPEWPIDKEVVNALRSTVDNAAHQVMHEMKNEPSGTKHGKGRGKRYLEDAGAIEGVEELALLGSAGQQKRKKARV